MEDEERVQGEINASMSEILKATVTAELNDAVFEEMDGSVAEESDIPRYEEIDGLADVEIESVCVIKIKEEIVHIPPGHLDNVEGEMYQTNSQNEMDIFYDPDKTLKVKDEPLAEDYNENIDLEDSSLPPLSSEELPKSQITLEYLSDRLTDPTDEIDVKLEMDADFHESYTERELEDSIQLELQDQEKPTIKEETDDQQDLLQMDGMANDYCENIPKEFTEVVPVSLKSNSEFQLSNGKYEMEMMLTKGASEVETIVPSESLLAQISGARQSKELILGYRSDHTKLRELNEDISDLLAPRGFECPLCNRRYQSMSTFQRHQKTHNAVQDTSKHLITEVDREPALPIEDIEAKDGMYSCNCGKGFRRKSSVLSCMRAHRNAGLGCQYCSQVVTRRDDLRRHCRLHHAAIIAAKYRCSVCSKTFSGRKALARHSRTHIVKKKIEEVPLPPEPEVAPSSSVEVIEINEAAEEPRLTRGKKSSPVKFKFTCRECGKGCATLGQLTNHKAQHKNKNKFQCDRCEENMSCRSELSSHRRLHCRSNETTSETTRVTRAALLSHPTPAVQPVQHACDVCARPFSTQELMQRHKATHPFVIFTKDDSTHTQIFFK